ncbi:gamma-glutamylcyclotransferase [Devosia sp.]|uniref:gamma-glutamylcyclotransferase n=1 Tax=Devosia sp. TaxID=1871048 RepID=UPI0025C3154F|nr:gamma-glutamylcyclotransferase [Devosia sp.]
MAYGHRKMRLTEAHLALLPARVDNPDANQPDGEQAPPDSYYSATTAALIDAVPSQGEMWLFAFGSLLWNKRFTSDDERPGMVRGWHRDFCLGPDTRFRGNPEAPGYTLSLDRGGQCKGMVYRLPREGLAANIEGLLRKEPPFPPRWLTVATPAGVVRAFAFTHPGKGSAYAGHLADEVVADALSRAVGRIGTMAEYVYLTVLHLERLGLCDDRMWRMQEMIADRIERAFPGKLPAG